MVINSIRFTVDYQVFFFLFFFWLLFIRFAWPTPMISRGSSKCAHFHNTRNLGFRTCKCYHQNLARLHRMAGVYTMCCTVSTRWLTAKEPIRWKCFTYSPKKRNWLNEVARATARNFLLLTLNIQIERRVHKLTLNVFIGIFFFWVWSEKRPQGLLYWREKEGRSCAIRSANGRMRTATHHFRFLLSRSRCARAPY